MDEKYYKFIFLAIPLFFVLIVLLCIGLTIFYSFTDASLTGGEIQFVGLQNYIELLGSRLFSISIQNNFILLLTQVSLPVIFGLLLAILLNRNVKGDRVFKTIFFFHE